jgi:hypothetical protein
MVEVHFYSSPQVLGVKVGPFAYVQIVGGLMLCGECPDGRAWYIDGLASMNEEGDWTIVAGAHEGLVFTDVSIYTV